MALGGGTWGSQNKVLPGFYINFVSAKNAGLNLADRGVVAFPTTMSWGPEKTVFTLTRDDFNANALNILAFEAGASRNIGLREIFKNSHTILLYRLNTGEKATCTYCDAKYSGVKGNDISIVISKNVDDNSKFDVKTKLSGVLVDVQTVSKMADLADNDFVVWKRSASLAATTGTSLTGGTGNYTDTSTVDDYKQAMDALSAYNFNALCISSTTEQLKAAVVERTKYMRDELGLKFQTVLYRYETADYEGVVSVQNAVANYEVESALVAWVAGAIAGCAVNKSNTNKTYDGEFEPVCTESQTALIDAIKAGKFMFHKVGTEVRVLEDINTLTTYTEVKSSDFASNQTIRIIDQIANDFARIFNNDFNGKIPNNESGRLSLWSRYVSHHKEMDRIGAIENFKADDIDVQPGEDKKSVVVNDAIQVINCMEKVYATVVVG